MWPVLSVCKVGGVHVTSAVVCKVCGVHVTSAVVCKVGGVHVASAAVVHGLPVAAGD